MSFKLLKFKLNNQSVIEINRFMLSFGLNSFHLRLIRTNSNVAFKILNDPSAGEVKFMLNRPLIIENSFPYH